MSGLTFEKPDMKNKLMNSLSRFYALSAGNLALTILSLTTLFFLLLYFGIVVESLSGKIVFYSLSGISIIGLFAFIGERILHGQTDTKQIWKRSSIITTLVLVIVIIGLGYHQVERLKVKIDLTINNILSLSPQTKKILDEVSQDIEIIGFFSEKEFEIGFDGQPRVVQGGEYERSRKVQHVLDLFREYSSRIKLRWVDKDKEPILAKQHDVQENGTLIFLVGGNKATAYRNDYLKMSFAGRQRQEINKLEEVVASKLLSLFETGKRLILFTSGHGEDTSSSAQAVLTRITGRLEEENYRLTNGLILDLQKEILSGDISVVVTIGPKSDFLPQEIEVLKLGAKKGINWLVLLDSPAAGAALSSRSRLLKYIKDDWSVSAGDDAIFTLIQTFMGLQIYPRPPVNIQDHAITKPLLSLERTRLPLSRSISFDSDSEYDGSPLLVSGSNVWAEKNLKRNPPQYDEGKDKLGPISTAVAVEKPADDSQRIRPQSRLVIFGNASFVDDRSILDGGSELGYLDLFMNSIGYLAGKSASISVRPKSLVRDSIVLDEWETIWILVIIIFIPPLAIIFCGFVIYGRRRRR